MVLRFSRISSQALQCVKSLRGESPQITWENVIVLINIDLLDRINSFTPLESITPEGITDDLLIVFSKLLGPPLVEALSDHSRNLAL